MRSTLDTRPKGAPGRDKPVPYEKPRRARLAPEMTQSTTKRAHLLIGGRVQGVGFRYSTSIEADSLGLNGWVRNLPDGRVEVVAEGTEAAVDRLVEWCRRGPRYAWVRNVDVAWEVPQDETGGFGVR